MLNSLIDEGIFAENYDIILAFNDNETMNYDISYDMSELRHIRRLKIIPCKNTEIEHTMTKVNKKPTQVDKLNL